MLSGAASRALTAGPITRYVTSRFAGREGPIFVGLVVAALVVFLATQVHAPAREAGVGVPRPAARVASPPAAAHSRTKAHPAPKARRHHARKRHARAAHFSAP